MNKVIYDDLMDDILFDIVIEVDMERRRPTLSLYDFYLYHKVLDMNVSLSNGCYDKGIIQRELDTARSYVTQYGSTISCPHCKQEIGGSRFATHLEKCMTGGKRGSRKHYDALDDQFFFQGRASKIDPHPDSLIVKIKMRKGVPWGNTRRVGASLEEFESGIRSYVYSQQQCPSSSSSSSSNNNNNNEINNGKYDDSNKSQKIISACKATNDISAFRIIESDAEKEASSYLPRTIPAAESSSSGHTSSDGQSAFSESPCEGSSRNLRSRKNLNVGNDIHILSSTAGLTDGDGSKPLPHRNLKLDMNKVFLPRSKDSYISSVFR